MDSRVGDNYRFMDAYGGLEWRSDEWAGGGEGAARDTYIRAARCVRGPPLVTRAGTV